MSTLLLVLLDRVVWSIIPVLAKQLSVDTNTNCCSVSKCTCTMSSVASCVLLVNISPSVRHRHLSSLSPQPPPYHQLYPNTNKTILVLRIHLIASGSISSRLSQRRLVKKDLHRESIARHNTSPHTTNLLPQHHIRLSCSLLDSTNTLSSRWKSHRELKRFSPRKESLSRTQQ